MDAVSGAQRLLLEEFQFDGTLQWLLFFSAISQSAEAPSILFFFVAAAVRPVHTRGQLLCSISAASCA